MRISYIVMLALAVLLPKTSYGATDVVENKEIQPPQFTISSKDANDTNTSEKESQFNKITLQEAVKFSVESNYRVKQAKERVIQAGYMVREAQADFLPQVSLSADTMRKRNNGFDIQDYSQSEYAATLTYNLFSSGKHLAQYNKNKIVKNSEKNGEPIIYKKPNYFQNLKKDYNKKIPNLFIKKKCLGMKIIKEIRK